MGNQRVRQTRSTLWASGRSFTGRGSLWVNLYEARERESQITDDLIDRIAAHPEDYDVAANKDSNARLEAETPDE